MERAPWELSEEEEEAIRLVVVSGWEADHLISEVNGQRAQRFGQLEALSEGGKQLLLPIPPFTLSFDLSEIDSLRTKLRKRGWGARVAFANMH